MNSYFPYPNLHRQIIEQEQKLRRSIQDTPELERLKIYEVFTAVAKGCVATSFEVEQSYVTAIQGEQKVVFPRPLPINIHAIITCGYEVWLKHKYTLPGFVEVDPSDTVIDCGAYVGGFSLSATKVAREVHLFEPEMNNVRCIARNLSELNNIRINSMGLYNINSSLLLNVSNSSVEHSFLSPDVGEVVEKRSVDVIRIEDYCEQNKISQIDFFKVEAEGVEVEVIEGLGKLKPSKLAVDVSPERSGLTPVEQISQLLVNIGYIVKRRANVLFARLK